MNERIKELALECYNPYGNFDHEKFAKLIIEECAGLFPLQHTDEQYQRRIDKTIRKHFGLYK